MVARYELPTYFAHCEPNKRELNGSALYGLADQHVDYRGSSPHLRPSRIRAAKIKASPTDPATTIMIGPQNITVAVGSEVEGWEVSRNRP